MSAAGADGAGPGAPPGLAAGTHGDLGVTVARDLSGSGRLARGGSTRFSTLRLTSAGAPAPRAEAAAADGALPSPRGAEPDPPPSADAPSGRPLARASPLRRLLGWLGLGRGPGRDV